jgi:hypothetical protein
MTVWSVATKVDINDHLKRCHRDDSSIEMSNWTICRNPFLTSPLGANSDPQGRSCPPGVNFVP